MCRSMTALETLERGYPRSREYRTQLIRLIEQTASFARCRNLSLIEGNLLRTTSQLRRLLVHADRASTSDAGSELARILP